MTPMDVATDETDNERRPQRDTWPKALFTMFWMLGILVILSPVGVVAIIIFLHLLKSSVTVHPSDEELMELVRAQRSDFVDLANMLYADERILYVDNDSHTPAGVLTLERQRLYATKLQALSIESGVSRSSDQMVFFHVSNKGSVLSSSIKGVVYRPSGDFQMYESLDTPPDGLKEGQLALRRIDEDFFISLSVRY
jgi:hypothetical protein